MDDNEFRQKARDTARDVLSTHGNWGSNRDNIRAHMINESMDGFLRWSTMIATMVVGDCGYIREEYNLLPDWIKEKITDPGFGDPPMIEGTPISATYAHQAFHLWQYIQMTGIQMDDIYSIVEFGGGYGAMSVVAHRLGFQGRYVIYDLPEMSLLQQYYLEKVGAHSETVPMSDYFSGVKVIHEPDLLIASYSLSECIPPFRSRFFDEIDPYTYLIAHQGIWEAEDINAYFDQFTGERKQYKHFVKPHPSNWFVGHNYRAGVK